MVSHLVHDSLSKRYFCDYDGICYRTSWDTWGRWVAFAVAAITIALLAFMFSCQNNRRRRNHGQPPMYGTGWIPGSKPYAAHGEHYNTYASYAGAPAPPCPPPYSPSKAQQFSGTTSSGNNGHPINYGPSDEGIQLQPPQNTYQPPRMDEPIYSAPPGPPPSKKN